MGCPIVSCWARCRYVVQQEIEILGLRAKPTSNVRNILLEAWKTRSVGDDAGLLIC